MGTLRGGAALRDPASSRPFLGFNSIIPQPAGKNGRGKTSVVVVAGGRSEVVLKGVPSPCADGRGGFMIVGNVESWSTERGVKYGEK